MSVPRHPNETAAEPAPDPNAKLYEANERQLEQYRQEAAAELQPIHPVDALGEVAAQMFPGHEMNPEQVAMARAHCDEPVCLTVASSGCVGCCDDALLDAEHTIKAQQQAIADLTAKLDAERTLRAQAAADLEREKAHERERRIQGDALARDRLWAIDALVEALGPLAGFATEEDGRVSGMTAPVCLAMSSVRRADALVKLHRALRR